MSQRVFHSIPFIGSSQFKSPTSAASGAVLNDEAVTNEYATRLTGIGSYCTNPEDIKSLSGPFRTSQVVVGPTTDFSPIPSGGNMPTRATIALYNLGPSAAYIYHAASGQIINAFPLGINGSFAIDLGPYHQIYAKTSSGFSDIRVIECT